MLAPAADARIRNGVPAGLLTLQHGRLPKVRGIGDLATLGVHQAGPDSVRGYVPREVDAQIRGLMSGSVFILLSGDAATGKTRTAYEAALAVLPNHTLVAPRGRGHGACIGRGAGVVSGGAG